MGKSRALTPAAAAAGPVPASALTERYEALRGQALGTPEVGAAGMGLGVLVHRGLAAWMATTASNEGDPEARRAAPLGERDPAAGALVTCIAQMILARGRRTA
jgi:hypothetical protein